MKLAPPPLPRAFGLLRIVLAVVSVTVAGHAQVADRNINMVSGTAWPGGDPFLQRQNEPSVAVSTRNPLHLLAGANDYRTVDLPGLPDDRVVGDAWLGLFKSFDGGLTWRSTLLPGYPQDSSPDGAASPLKGFEAGADPTLRAGTNGLFYYSGIVFNRGENALGRIFVARFIDHNNVEGGDPVAYLSTAVIDTGTAGQFIDKPWLAVDIPRNGAGTCRIGGQTVPAGNVYLVYSVFTGGDNNPRTKIMFARSTDCGVSWSVAKLSESFTLNQGATIAIDPNSGAVHVVWRQFQTTNAPHAMIAAKSTDGGRTFTKGTQVAVIDPFEQGTTAVSFRTNAFPTMAADGNGRVYLAWAQRGAGACGDARIVVTASTDGVNWTTPAPADPSPERGHQLMPALASAAGKVMLLYYDLRDDHTVGVFSPLGDGLFAETRVPVGGDLMPAPCEPGNVFTQFIADAAPAGFPALRRRHTLDVRAAEARVDAADPNAPPAFGPSQRVSQYVFGSRPGSQLIEQLQVNPPNLPLFRQGTAPFIGDYIDLAATAFLPAPDGGWTYNTSASGGAVFHAVWTDNRDVRPPAGSPPDWKNYTPPSSDPSCNPDFTASRNQNIYTSRITDGLYVGAAGNSKQLGAILVDGSEVLLQRAFSVFAQNATYSAKSFRMTIEGPQPTGGQASFKQYEALTSVDVTIAPRSTVARTVFATSTDRRARIVVSVAEISAPGADGTLPGGLRASVVLNPDRTNPDLAGDPNAGGQDIAGAEVYNPDIAGLPAVISQDIANQDIANPDIANPDIANQDIANPDIANQDIANQDIANPDIANQDIANPDIANQDIANSTLTDSTWTINNTGNTAASFDVKLVANGTVPNGFKLQLILYKTYLVPVARGCTLGVQRQNIVLASIPNPVFTSVSDLGTTDPANPAVTNATISLAPGETAKLTLRVWDPDREDDSTFDPAAAVSPVLVAQGVNTGGARAPMTLVVTTTNPMPEGLKNEPYQATLRALGGEGAYGWRVSGGALPPGLSLDPATGEITGTPTARGSFAFTAEVQDSASPGHSATRHLVIHVRNRQPSVGFVPGSTLVVDEGASVTLNPRASDPDGDSLTYGWSLSGPGTLTPSGDGSTAEYRHDDGPASATVQVTVTDGSGGTATATRTVEVRNVAPVVGEINAPLGPVAPGTAVGLSAGFIDPGTADTHTAVWEWGDGTSSPAAVTEQQPSGDNYLAGSAAGTHTYAAAGVYEVRLTVTDKDGDSGAALFRYVVVSDTSGQRATGGGWIVSPPGASALVPSFGGKSNFGFNAWPAGGGAPSGQTQFQAGALNFHSTAYTSVTVSGAKARVAGLGAVNGVGGYGFVLSVIDGQAAGGKGDDRFRIKIWDGATGAVVYDNQAGAPDGADPAQAIAAGNIDVKTR